MGDGVNLVAHHLVGAWPSQRVPGPRAIQHAEAHTQLTQAHISLATVLPDLMHQMLRGARAWVELATGRGLTNELQHVRRSQNPTGQGELRLMPTGEPGMGAWGVTTAFVPRWLPFLTNPMQPPSQARRGHFSAASRPDMENECLTYKDLTHCRV